MCQICPSVIAVSQAGPYSKAQNHRRVVHINILVSVTGCERWRSKPDGRRDSLYLWPSSRQHRDNSAITARKIGIGGSVVTKMIILFFFLICFLQNIPSTKLALAARSISRHVNVKCFNKVSMPIFCDY